MDLKQQEINTWLSSVYGSGSSPKYDKTGVSIDILHQLMLTSRSASAKAETLNKDYIVKTNEYKAKGAELSKVLNGVGINSGMLSNEGQSALNCISETAVAVQAKNPSEAVLLLGCSKLESNHDKVLANSSSSQLLQSQLIEASKQLATKLEHVRKLEASADVGAALEEKETLAMSRRQLFYEKKLTEYQTEIAARQVELQHRGYNSSFSHTAVVQQSSKLRTLQQQVDSLRSQLEAYSLPPSVAGARLAVEEMRQQITALMENLTAC